MDIGRLLTDDSSRRTKETPSVSAARPVPIDHRLVTLALYPDENGIDRFLFLSNFAKCPMYPLGVGNSFQGLTIS